MPPISRCKVSSGSQKAERFLTRIWPSASNQKQQGGLLGADPFQTGNKVDHIAGGPAAEAVIPAVNLHAGVPVVMEGAAAHPIPVCPDAKMLGDLPGGDRLFHSFKNAQIGGSS